MNSEKRRENVIIAVLVGVSVCLFLMSLTVFKEEGFRADLDYLMFLQGVRDRAGSQPETYGRIPPVLQNDPGCVSADPAGESDSQIAVEIFTSFVYN